jgi:hypothetical protein
MTTETTVIAAPGLTARASVMAARTKDAATIGVPAAILTAMAITGGKIVLLVICFQTKKEGGQPDLLLPLIQLLR